MTAHPEPEPTPKKARAKQPAPKSSAKPSPKPSSKPSAARSNRATFDLFERRRQRLEALTAADLANQRRMALAMCKFDRLTDPQQLQHDGDARGAEQILAMTLYLVHRVKQRVGYGRQQRAFEPTPVPAHGDDSDRAGTRALIAAVERRCREALVAAFPSKQGKLFPIREFERTFAAFVGGELRTGLLAKVAGEDDLAMHGVPDGANYFCFAEAALLFVHCRLHAGFWTPLLRTFVGGSQVFAATYWDQQTRTWGSYRTEHQKRLVPSPVVLAGIDQFHAAMTPSQLAEQFTTIVAVALRDEPTIPEPALVAPEFR